MKIESRKSEEVINIAAAPMKEVIENSGVGNSMVNLLWTGTPAGTLVTESTPCLEEDILTRSARISPENEYYHHQPYLDYEGRQGLNAETHLKSVFISNACSR